MGNSAGADPPARPPTAARRTAIAPKEAPRLPGVETCWDNWRTSVEQYPDNHALGRVVDGAYSWLTYKEAGEQADAIGSAMVAAGVEPHGRCGIYGANSPEWMIAMQVGAGSGRLGWGWGWGCARLCVGCGVVRGLGWVGLQRAWAGRRAVQVRPLVRGSLPGDQAAAAQDAYCSPRQAANAGGDHGSALPFAPGPRPRSPAQACSRQTVYCVPLYDTLGENAIEYIIAHSGGRAAPSRSVALMCFESAHGQRCLSAVIPGCLGFYYWLQTPPGSWNKRVRSPESRVD